MVQCAALPDCNVYWLYPSPAFPAADCGGSALLHTAHHTIIITDHSCRHPNLLMDLQAVIVCCTMQVSYGLVGVVHNAGELWVGRGSRYR